LLFLAKPDSSTRYTRSCESDYTDDFKKSCNCILGHFIEPYESITTKDNKKSI